MTGPPKGVISLTQENNMILVSPWLKGIEYEATVHKKERETVPGRGVVFKTREIPLYWPMPESPAGTIYAGLRKPVTAYLKRNGYAVDYTDLRETLPQIDVDVPGITYRGGQREVLVALTTEKGGIIRCPPAWGKSFVIEMFCYLNPDLRILVSTARQDVLKELRIRIQKRCPGRVVSLCNGASKPKRDATVIVCSDRSLHKIHPEWPQVVLYDEVHNAGAETAMQGLFALLCPRFYGFSATPNRTDGANKTIEAIFGGKIADISHMEAVDAGTIVPMEARMVPNRGTVLQLNSDYQVQCFGYWHNGERNAAIAQAVRKLEGEGFAKVLVMTATTEHAYILRMFLPEYTVVHAGIDPQLHQELVKKGYILPQEDPNINPDWIREWFKEGKLTHVIATTKWKEGVDFPDLEVIVRADGQTSFTSGIQIGGRTSRLFAGKGKGIVVDFDDGYGPELEGRAWRRKANYRAQGWNVVSWPVN